MTDSPDRAGSDLTALTRMSLKRLDASELVMGDELLRSSALVKMLGGETARALLRQAITRRYADNVAVYKQAQTGDSLFLIVRGQARLFAQLGSDTVELGSAVKGELIGESELLAASVERSSSAVAFGELDAVELPKAEFSNRVEGCARLFDYLRELNQRRRATSDEMADFLKRW